MKSQFAWDLQSHSLHMIVGLCPFRSLYVREFELSHSNLACEDTGCCPFYNNSSVKDCKLFTWQFTQMILRNHLTYSVSAQVTEFIVLRPREIKQACMDLCPVMIIHYISIGFSTTLQLSVKEQFFKLGLSIRALDSSRRWKGLLYTFQCKLTEIPLIFYSYLMQSKINIITLRNWSPNNTSSRFLHF